MALTYCVDERKKVSEIATHSSPITTDLASHSPMTQKQKFLSPNGSLNSPSTGAASDSSRAGSSLHSEEGFHLKGNLFDMSEKYNGGCDGGARRRRSGTSLLGSSASAVVAATAGGDLSCPMQQFLDTHQYQNPYCWCYQQYSHLLQPECHLKHPLQNTWTLWYLECDRSKSWEELQNEITSFNTVEDFWYLFHHIKLPSELKIGSDYSLFKQGIKPMWEDPANVMGGRWIITLGRQYRKTILDNLWQDILLCLIGEVFNSANQICGAVVNIRTKVDKISLWTADAENQEGILDIGNELKDVLNYNADGITVAYQAHKDNIGKHGSNAHYMYTLIQ